MRKFLLLLVAVLPGIIVFSQPVITSFAPLSGPIGSTVTINGTGFSTTAVNNIVFFGSVKAAVSTASATQLTVTVPAGASYEPITVTVSNRTGYARQPFNVIFPNADPHITTSSFTLNGSYATGNYPFSIRLCDLNDDGKPEILTVNANDNTISVLKNTSSAGDISFSPKTDFATGLSPRYVATGDLDGDGKPDLAVCNFNSGGAASIGVLLNTSSGGTISFAPRTDFPTGDGTLGLAIADMDGDGRPDIVTTSGNSGWFSILFNSTVTPGNVSFSRQDFTLFFHPDRLAVADLDKDGRPDLVTANFGNSSISVFRNTSSGGSFSLASRLDYTVGSNPSYLAIGDLDDDGYADIAVTNYSSASISLLKNNSGSGFIAIGGAQDIPVATASNLVISDINGDGKPDLAMGYALTGKASVMENTVSSAGSFSLGSPVDFTTGNFDTQIAVGDLDGDGRPELAVCNTLLNTVSTAKNVMSIPSVTSVTATTANAGDGITLNGTNFTGATALKFGGTPAASFTVVSPTRIDAVVAGGASGTITVATPLGTASLSGFTFTPQITTDGPAAICNHDIITMHSTAAVNNQWYKDNIAITGATGTSYQTGIAGVYTVKTTSNSITTVSTGIAVAVTVIPTPAITITASNDLSSSSATGNQWYLNGTAITGATSQIYHPVAGGNYTVTTTSNGCTSDPSTPVNYNVTGVIDLGNNQFIKLYPVPVTGNLYINWNISGASVLQIVLTDMQGRQLLLQNALRAGSSIDCSRLAKGVYFIRLYNQQLKLDKTIKILKTE